ncbi:hypothetical protein [uncultured Nocardioides sp.]|uniref:hypothetical protein n=1 Tax=uncultured Nocardioides sp. TaxID=198441 RepID=UPI0026133FCB|nr:hypothetical protein [uncultured Nocardioides sp.]
MSRSRFSGAIAGVGSASGVRVVVGRWDDGPWGRFADVMVETADGHRVLLAPTERVRRFVAATYTFDEERIEPVTVTGTRTSWHVRTPSLTLDLEVGRRSALGVLLRAVPRRLATSPAWCAVTDPVARVVMDGVRTVGTAREGRREWYGATDLHRVTALTGSFDGVGLGELADVDPPCRFGFSSAPRTPSVTAVVTTVDDVAGDV